MNTKKKYKVIAKVGPDKFVKYNVDNLIRFTAFLDRRFNDWRYFNVFDKDTQEQLISFTKNNRPETKYIIK